MTDEQKQEAELTGMGLGIEYASWVTADRIAEDAREYPRIEGGHSWIRDDGLVDYFRMSEGYHNGPECARCYESFCQHCTPEALLAPCPEAGTELPGMELT